MKPTIFERKIPSVVKECWSVVKVFSWGQFVSEESIQVNGIVQVKGVNAALRKNNNKIVKKEWSHLYSASNDELVNILREVSNIFLRKGIFTGIKLTRIDFVCFWIHFKITRLNFRKYLFFIYFQKCGKSFVFNCKSF